MRLYVLFFPTWERIMQICTWLRMTCLAPSHKRRDEIFWNFELEWELYGLYLPVHSGIFSNATLDTHGKRKKQNASSSKHEKSNVKHLLTLENTSYRVLKTCAVQMSTHTRREKHDDWPLATQWYTDDIHLTANERITYTWPCNLLRCHTYPAHHMYLPYNTGWRINVKG